MEKSGGTDIAHPEPLGAWNHALRRALKAVKGRRVLEVGCGEGRFIRAICRRLPQIEGYGCDIDPRVVTRATAFPGGVAYLTAEAAHLPYATSSFDAVLIFDVLEHLWEPEEALREVSRVLKPGGILHALVPCEGQPLTLHWLMARLRWAADLKERHGGHVQRFRHRDVLALLHQSGFHVNTISYSMHPLGQVKDILTYLAREGWAQGALLSLLLRGAILSLWGASYLESFLLGCLSLSGVAMHVTAEKRRP
ncbi:MAG: class I SAM-dependent methyltransferase [Chloroflexi bacterium]|nr:class I SAM-dependent methyltransferase [Chloroflexota bacterium]